MACKTTTQTSRRTRSVRKYTTTKKIETIFNKSVLYGQAIKSNIYMDRATVLHELNERNLRGGMR